MNVYERSQKVGIHDRSSIIIYYFYIIFYLVRKMFISFDKSKNY
jgi:hypothetical protein